MEDTKQTKHLKHGRYKTNQTFKHERYKTNLYLPCLKCLVCFVSSMF
jgi:hypothetical protein